MTNRRIIFIYFFTIGVLLAAEGLLYLDHRYAQKEEAARAAEQFDQKGDSYQLDKAEMVDEAYAEVGVGQTVYVNEIAILFNEMVQDNRCAVDTQCPETGAVTINVTFQKGDHMETKNMPSDEAPQSFSGYDISIDKVKPELRSNVRINPDGYVIVFKVVRQKD